MRLMRSRVRQWPRRRRFVALLLTTLPIAVLGGLALGSFNSDHWQIAWGFVVVLESASAAGWYIRDRAVRAT
jgi:hypothetical protein